MFLRLPEVLLDCAVASPLWVWFVMCLCLCLILWVCLLCFSFCLFLCMPRFLKILVVRHCISINPSLLTQAMSGNIAAAAELELNAQSYKRANLAPSSCSFISLNPDLLYRRCLGRSRSEGAIRQTCRPLWIAMSLMEAGITLRMSEMSILRITSMTRRIGVSHSDNNDL